MARMAQTPDDDRQDPLYSSQMDRLAGITTQTEKRKDMKKSKKGSDKVKGLPDPQYLMMLKMIDPNIDMVD